MEMKTWRTDGWVMTLAPAEGETAVVLPGNQYALARRRYTVSAQNRRDEQLGDGHCSTWEVLDLAHPASEPDSESLGCLVVHEQFFTDEVDGPIFRRTVWEAPPFLAVPPPELVGCQALEIGGALYELYALCIETPNLPSRADLRSFESLHSDRISNLLLQAARDAAKHGAAGVDDAPLAIVMSAEGIESDVYVCLTHSLRLAFPCTVAQRPAIVVVEHSYESDEPLGYPYDTLLRYARNKVQAYERLAFRTWIAVPAESSETAEIIRRVRPGTPGKPYETRLDTSLDDTKTLQTYAPAPANRAHPRWTAQTVDEAPLWQLVDLEAPTKRALVFDRLSPDCSVDSAEFAPTVMVKDARSGALALVYDEDRAREHRPRRAWTVFALVGEAGEHAVLGLVRARHMIHGISSADLSAAA
jgi:hypothetical protein